jgi:hypothetical protein
MSQLWIAQVLQEHEEAIQRHQHYVAAHEAIIRVLRAYEQQTITKAQALAQLEEAAASEVELGLVGVYRQTIERLCEPREERR